MLTLKKINDSADTCVETAGSAVEDLLKKEWLLSNTRGGYASSSITGCNTRRYHGLLIGAMEPPAKRIAGLSNCVEEVTFGPDRFNLSTFEFPDKIWPEGYLRLKGFCRDAGVHFDYEIGDIRLTKSIYLLRERDTAAIVYDFTEVNRPVYFTIRPLAAMRNYHSLQKSGAELKYTIESESVIIRDKSNCGLLLKCQNARFVEDQQWWYNFTYRIEKERVQDCAEDLFSPGVFIGSVNAPGRIILWADLGSERDKTRFILPDIEEVVESLSKHRNSITANAKGDRTLGTLFLAADQFIVKRKTDDRGRKTENRTENAEHRTEAGEHTTILAGYPWFLDWGRDAFISLPGLLLSTRRFDEAKSALLTFAGAASEGMIPNCFDDYGGAPHYNSVDASLWFINASFAYLEASKDKVTFRDRLLPVIISIIESYRKGTRFGIHADGDGLITAGDSDTQLTWMDAKCCGIVFTPRYGKPVEVNALWFNALVLLDQFYEKDKESHDGLKGEIKKVKKSFCKLYWNKTLGYLNDCIFPDGRADESLRPNQIFAVSLPYSPLNEAQKKAIVNIIEKKLLTPFGLRTLSTDDSRYRGQYRGCQQERDGAYHQGTVWPYLTGPFVEAYLKVNGFGLGSKKRAARFIEPLLEKLTSDGCLGQISEVFDGDKPDRPKGCFAQAWSVAELIRAYMMIFY